MTAGHSRKWHMHFHINCGFYSMHHCKFSSSHFSYCDYSIKLKIELKNAVIKSLRDITFPNYRNHASFKFSRALFLAHSDTVL